MEEVLADFAVIGSGPAGQKGAIQAAKLGWSVVMIEKDHHPGGNCLNYATIPSKSLREAIIDLRRYNERAFYGSSCLTEVTVNDLNFRLHAVLDGERAVLMRQLRKNHIRYIQGAASFTDPQELHVLGEHGEVRYRVQAKKYLIATGSEPRRPIDVPFDEDVILDSNKLLRIDHVPKTMIVLGGGVIGAEYASFFTALGTEVWVIDKKNRLLPELDAEIGTHLQIGLKENGLHLLPGKTPSKILRVGNRAEVHCDDGSLFSADLLLYALGREAEVKTLNLSLRMTDRGHIAVNEYFQTSCSHIYAAGDVVGYPALASTSMEQGRLAALHAVQGKAHPFPKWFPLGIYTIPEISCCGATEEDLQKQGTPYEVGRAYYYEIARSHITGSSHLGMFKLLFDPENLTLFGVHIVGRNATELIHIGQMVMALGGNIEYFVNQVFNYPTFAEGYRIAAFNGLNKLKRG